MCGFLCEYDRNRPIDLASFDNARDTMISRGPDNGGTWVSPDGKVALGHRRLAIIDLDENANQPFFDEPNSTILVFNGEIYNFCELKSELIAEGISFRTTSDTEVLYRGYLFWGSRVLDKLIGMFAFCIYDQLQESLFIARDRIGVKPLYYWISEDRLVCGSSVKAILSCLGDLDVALDESSVNSFIDLGWSSHETQFVKGVKQLFPGHSLDYSLRLGDSKTQRYWSFDHASQVSESTCHKSTKLCSVEARTASFSKLIEQAVECRLVSDVPFGAFLSGGVDSSLVVSMMTKLLGSGVKTYTAAFEDPKYNESVHAKRIAMHLGCNHHEFVLNDQNLLSEVEFFLENIPEPHADLAALPTLALARRAQKDVKVCLVGDGGDELFYGYPIFAAMKKYSWLRILPRPVRLGLAKSLALSESSSLSLLSGFLYQKSMEGQYLYLRSLGKSVQRRSWKLPDHLKLSSRLAPDQYAREMDLLSYLPDALLRKTDIASMMVSLEVREPLLDHRLAESAASLLWKDTPRKQLLKAILAQMLPEHLWNRPKHSFDVPIDDWLRKSLSPLMDKLVDEWSLETIAPKYEVERLVSEQRRGKRVYGEIIWSLLCLNCWYQSNFCRANRL